MYSLKLKIEFIDRELYPNWGQGCAIVDFGRCRGWKVIHSLSSSLLHLQQSSGWGVPWVIYKSTADQLQSTDSYYNCKTSINLFENTCICNMITIWIWNWMFFLHEEKKICTDFCWLLFFRPNGQRWNVFFHFTGSVPGSNCLESMLKRLLIEMEVLNVRCSFE